ncbi:MAG: HAMP domain-containing histidine kinase [Acidobacteria bacterium]|nr:HAMP domain-containing histidine kinase [Acidobacteriota bacterium]
MNANIPEVLMLLCQADGQVVMADRNVVSLLTDKETAGGETVPVQLSQFAMKMNCAELTAFFDSFVFKGEAVTQGSVGTGANKCRFLLRRLNGFQSVPLFAVELIPETDEQSRFAEVGRTTARLIHDFKNQMGGIKLYAAYLKKRFAANVELADGLEIADKIVQTLNEMTENASLIVKLSRPLEPKLSEVDFNSLVEQAINQLQPDIEERHLKLKTKFSQAPPLCLDTKLMFSAIITLLEREIQTSTEGAELRLKTENKGGELIFSIFDESEPLTEEQRQSFFAMVTNERMNKTSLNLALAQRIIESHGGKVAVLEAMPSGSELRVTFGI